MCEGLLSTRAEERCCATAMMLYSAAKATIAVHVTRQRCERKCDLCSHLKSANAQGCRKKATRPRHNGFRWEQGLSTTGGRVRRALYDTCANAYALARLHSRKIRLENTHFYKSAAARQGILGSKWPSFKRSHRSPAQPINGPQR